MQTITDGIYYENAYAGVTLGAIILPRGTLLIDTPLQAEDARFWKSILLAHSLGEYRLMINLDMHTDRIIGNRSIGLTILAHQEVAETIDNRTAVFKGASGASSSEWEKCQEVIGTRWIRPDITFSTCLNLHWGEPEILIEHHPGPAPGAIWVEIASKKIVFVGDAVVEHQPPFLADADLLAWIETLSVLRTPKYRDYTIVSGRSGPLTIEAVRSQHEFLRSVLRRLETLINRKAPPEETEKMIPALLAKITYPPELEDFYAQRLRYGLRQYYIRHYRTADSFSKS